MRTKPSQPNRKRPLIIVLLTVLVMSLSMIYRVSADVNADFDGYAEDTQVETIPPNDIPGIASIGANPTTTILIKELAVFFGLGAPFAGQSVLATASGSTMTINFALPQDSYAFDFATQSGTGTTVFTVAGYRAGVADPVFTDPYPVPSPALYVSPTQAAGSGIVFDRLVLSVTSGIWAMDNLSTTDNAAVSVSLFESGGTTNVTEGAATDTYQVVLDTAPTGDVIIDITPDAECTVNPTQLTFTTGTFAPQTVTVTAVNDTTEEASPHDCVITHDFNVGTTDVDYPLTSISAVTANVTDNDTPGVTITESGGSTDVTEGGATDTYTIVLESQPPDNVTVTADPEAECNLGSGAGVAVVKTFTNGNWFTPQPVTVTAVNDAVVEGAHTCTITHATGGDPSYAAAPLNGDPVVANISDNDGAGVNENFDGFPVNETVENLTIVGITDMFSVPADSTFVFDNVTIPAPFAGRALINESVGTMTINFTLPQDSYTFDYATNNPIPSGGSDLFTVTGFRAGSASPVFTDDTPVSTTFSQGIASRTGDVFDQLVISATTDAWAMDNLVTTNAPAGVVLFESAGSTNVTEGGATDTYQIALDSPPTSAVNITFTPDSQCTVSPNPLVFSASTFAPQTVTVTAVNDLNIEASPHNCVITQDISSGDGDYDVLTLPNVTAQVSDNDSASVTITETGGSTDVVEGGATDTYNITLGAAPTANVTVHITTDGECNVNPVDLIFSTGSVGPLPVTVTAFDDALVQGLHTCSIDHSVSSTDTNYNGITPVGTPVVANVTDDDSVSVNITETGGSTNVTEGGSTDTYNITLSTAPTANVTVHITTNGQCTVSQSNPVFTTGNTGPITITVTAFDDVFAQGPHTCTLDHTVTSTDTNYDGITPTGTPVIANVTDNEAASPAGAAPLTTIFNTHTVVLTWNRIAGAAGYEVQVDTDKAFALPNTLDDASISATTLTRQLTGLANSTYYWRVRAKSASGVFGAWSVVNSFIVSAP